MRVEVRVRVSERVRELVSEGLSWRVRKKARELSLSVICCKLVSERISKRQKARESYLV